MTNLGNLYQEMGNFYVESRSYLEKALEIRQEILEENHPLITQSMTNLGKIYQHMGNYRDAESLFTRSLKITQNQIYIANIYTSFGYLYYEKGEYG